MPERRSSADGSNIKAVAQIAGVSVGTVSNVLNRPEKVAADTRRRVEAVMASVGFVRNSVAANVRLGRSQLIGLIVPDITNPFFAEVARGAVDEAFAAGYALVLCNSEGSAERQAKYLNVLEEQRAAGVLINPVGGSLAPLDRARERGTRVVLVDRAAPVRNACSASVDDVLGGQLAVDHLISRGARSVVLVNGPSRLRQCADRRRGARRAVQRAGLTADALVEVVSPVMSIAGGVAVAPEVLRQMPAVDGIFCANDLLAIGVCRALAPVRAVPGDLLVVGYDDIPVAAEAPIPLSSVEQPKYELGQTAAQLLLDEITGAEHTRHRHVSFTPSLVQRDSTRRDAAVLTVA
jgi:LacI family transcriptional regulator